MKKFSFIFIFFVLVILFCFCGCKSKENIKIKNIEELNSKEFKIITSRDSACSVASEEAFPNAVQVNMESHEDCLSAVYKGNADAFVVEKAYLNKALLNNTIYTNSLAISDETLGTVNIAVGLQKDDKNLKAAVNSFIKKIKADGTLEEFLGRWYIDGADKLPQIDEPKNPTHHYKIATCGYLAPSSYVNSEGDLVGYDIEFIKRFALYANAEVEIVIMNFSDIIEALENKTIDAAVSNLHITEERKETIDYSDPYDVNEMVVCMRKDRLDSGTKSIKSLDELNSEEFKLIAETGSACAIVSEQKFPNANRLFGTLTADCFVSVLENKVDGYVIEKMTYEKSVKTNPSLAQNLTTIGGSIGSIDLAVGLPKGKDEIKNLFNRFIATIETEGILNDMKQRWLIDDIKSIPDDIPVPENPTQKFTIGTCGFIDPWSYVGDNGELNGFDIELIKRFAAFANAEIDIQVMNFDALIASLESGRLDAVVSDLNITEERQKIIDYSNPYYVSYIVVCVHRDLINVTEEDLLATKIEDLNGKIIGIEKDSPYLYVSRKFFDESTVSSFESSDELANQLKTYQVDAIVLSEPETEMLKKTNENFIVVDDEICPSEMAICISPKRENLKESIDEIIKRYREDGTLDKLREKWITGDNVSDKAIDFSTEYSAPNGVLNINISSNKDGFSFINNFGDLVGYDIELMMMIAKELEYTCAFTSINYSAVAESVASGKADLGIGAITIDENHSEYIYSNPTYHSACKVIILNNNSKSEDIGFIEGIKSSFKRTFIDESRWKMVVRGIFTTMEITVLAVIFGTVLGIFYSFILRSKIKPLSFFGRIFSNLLNATPIVVILMVLYYIVFSDSEVAPLTVAIIGFAIDFGNTVANLINTGITAIGQGQIEAAKTLGFSKWAIFTDILFPQAANQMFGTYRTAIINLIKATAVVGYITIEDLTRVSDIIRSRTYEAFFPLISTAIIYIILARLVIELLKIADRYLDPKQRKNILKGVATK